jgi:hypothetical protein
VALLTRARLTVALLTRALLTVALLTRALLTGALLTRALLTPSLQGVVFLPTSYRMHAATYPPTPRYLSPQGVFLPTSYRMHPALCDLVSELVYDGRLLTQPQP